MTKSHLFPLSLAAVSLLASAAPAHAADAPPMASFHDTAFGLTLSYPAVMTERVSDGLPATLRRYGRTIDPKFHNAGSDHPLPDACLRPVFHVRAPARATAMLTMEGGPPTATMLVDDLVVTEFDRGCLVMKDPAATEFMKQHAPELLMDILNHGYGFDPVDFTHHPQAAYPKMESVDAVSYVVSSHRVVAGVTQVTPDQSEPPGRKPPPPLERDIRAVTAIHGIVDVGGHLLIISSMAGPFAAIPRALRVHIAFGDAPLAPLFGFAITSLNPVTGEGIDLGPSEK